MDDKWWGAITAGAYILALAMVFSFGIYQGERNIIQHCSDYKAYVLEGTQKLLCSVVITPELPASTLTDEFYSQENKDKNRKNRK